MKRNLITDKKVFYAGLVYLISIVLFIGLRILWSTGFLSGLDPIFNDLVFSIIMQVLVLTALPVLLWKTLCKQTFKQTLDRFFVKKISLPVVLYSILLGVLVYVLIIYISTFWSILLQFFGYNPSGSSSAVSNLPVWLAFFLSVISTSLLPGFGEETAHRGLLMGNARNNGLKRAILLSALMFALAHLNIGQFGYAFVVGIILGACTFITRSIFPAMIIHATSNFCSVYASFATQNDWFGGSLLDSINGFIADNWLAGLILAFLLLLVVVILIAITISRLYFHTKNSQFEEFTERLKKLIKGTPTEQQVDFNNRAQMYMLYSQAAANDLRDKIDKGVIPITYLEKALSNSPVNTILYSEFDEYQKPSAFNYLFYYIAIFLASVVTLMTFLWGII